MACAALALVPATHAQSSRPGYGSTPYHDAQGTGVTFRVWAPNATSVYVPNETNGWSTTGNRLTQELTNGVGDGIWSADVSNARAGEQYKYYINYGGSGFWKHDPRARKVVNAGSAPGDNDIIYDPTSFNWTGDSLSAPGLNDLVVYELHIGSFYAPRSGLPGLFTDATNKLGYLQALGVSAIEILPIAEFPGAYDWGYDPADPYAADN